MLIFSNSYLTFNVDVRDFQTSKISRFFLEVSKLVKLGSAAPRDAGGRSQDGSNRELAGRTPGKILRAGDACASCGVVYGGAISCGCGDLPALQAFRQPNALPLRKSRYQRYRVYWHLQVRRRKRSQGRSGPSTRFLSVRVS